MFEKSELRRDVWDLLRGNNRIPEITVADLEAMIGACKVGVQRIRALVDRYGVETVCEGGEYTLDYSERALRSAIAQWADGVYRGRSPGRTRTSRAWSDRWRSCRRARARARRAPG